MAPKRILLAALAMLTLALAGCTSNTSSSSDGGLVDVNFGGSESNSCYDCDDDWQMAVFFGPVFGLLFLLLLIVGLVAAFSGGDSGGQQQQQQVVVVRGDVENGPGQFNQNQRY